MEIRKRFHKNTVILYVSGKIDADSALLIEETGRLAREGIRKILISLANVELVDYNGLSILAIAYKNAVNQNGIIKFCNVPAHARALLKAARLDSVFDIYTEEEEAIQSFDVSTRVDTLSLRRRFKRMELGVPARYKTGLSSDSKLFRGKILNLSGEGLFLYSKNTFPVSTRLYLELKLYPLKAPLAITGEVVWLADRELQPHAYPGMGISFVDIGRAAQREVINYIDKNIIRRSRI